MELRKMDCVMLKFCSVMLKICITQNGRGSGEGFGVKLFEFFFKKFLAIPVNKYHWGLIRVKCLMGIANPLPGIKRKQENSLIILYKEDAPVQH